MNRLTKGKGWKKYMAAALALILICGSGSVACAGIKQIPNTSVLVDAGTKLKTNNTNCSFTWTGVNGKVVTHNGIKIVCVPIKSTASSFSYTNFLDIKFTNAGQICGRKLDVYVHFNEFRVAGAREWAGSYDTSDGYMGIAEIQAGEFGLGNGVLKGYPAPKYADITVTIRYQDTGEIVSLPFFQSIRDLDVWLSSMQEGWEAISGFSDFYIYPNNVLARSGNKWYCPSSAYQGTNYPLSQTRNGLYATTSNGTFRSRHYLHDCYTSVMLYNQYEIMSDPVKTIR